MDAEPVSSAITTAPMNDQSESSAISSATSVHMGRNILLCYKSSRLWPEHGDFGLDTLPKLLDNAVVDANRTLPYKTSLTIFEKVDGLDFSDGDVLCFPEDLVYRGLNNANVVTFVGDVHVNNAPWMFGEREPLTGYYIFVWGDDNMIENIKKMIEAKGLQNPVHVIACCQVEGERVEGELSIFLACSAAGYGGNWFPALDTTQQTLTLLDRRIDEIEAKLNGSSSSSGSDMSADIVRDPNAPPNSEESSRGSNSADEPEDMALG